MLIAVVVRLSMASFAVGVVAEVEGKMMFELGLVGRVGSCLCTRDSQSDSHSEAAAELDIDVEAVAAGRCCSWAVEACQKRSSVAAVHSPAAVVGSACSGVAIGQGTVR